MTELRACDSEPLRTSDLASLRHILSARSIVMRVKPDGSFVPYQYMPSLFFERPLRQALSEDADGHFTQACARAIETKQRVVFSRDSEDADDVLVAPILDDTSDVVRFLIGWVRGTRSADRGTDLDWRDLEIADVVTRYRLRTEHDHPVVEVSPWWAYRDGLHELWPHHTHISAMGLGHAAMEMLIIDAAEAAAEMVGGPAVRVTIPSAEILSGLVPVFHGSLRASGIDPARMIVAIDVELAVDPDLLPIIVHLRTMGLKVDIVGLDSLTSMLHNISDTSDYLHAVKPEPAAFGPWTTSFATACAQAV